MIDKDALREADRNWDGSWSCEGKETYPNRGKALLRIKRYGCRGHRKGLLKTVKLDAYRCKLCGKWHVGNGAAK